MLLRLLGRLVLPRPRQRCRRHKFRHLVSRAIYDGVVQTTRSSRLSKVYLGLMMLSVTHSAAIFKVIFELNRVVLLRMEMGALKLLCIDGLAVLTLTRLPLL